MKFEYNIVFSKRKTLGITVKGDNVTVRAPYRTAKSIIYKFLTDHEEWVLRALEKQKIKAAHSPKINPEEEQSLRKAAKEYFNCKTKEYADIMGLKYGRITITSAKTRFGSCSNKGNICFSYRLMAYPEAAREYVIVHELCHLVEMNHSKKFYALVERYLPDYRERKKLLC